MRSWKEEARSLPTVLEVIVRSLPVVVIMAVLFWDLRFLVSWTRGERAAMKWRELGSHRRALSVLLMAYLGFSLYLSVASFLGPLGAIVSPLVASDSSILLWSGTLSLLGLALLLSLTHPQKTASKAPVPIPP